MLAAESSTAAENARPANAPHSREKPQFSAGVVAR